MKFLLFLSGTALIVVWLNVVHGIVVSGEAPGSVVASRGDFPEKRCAPGENGGIVCT